MSSSDTAAPPLPSGVPGSPGSAGSPGHPGHPGPPRAAGIIGAPEGAITADALRSAIQRVVTSGALDIAYQPIVDLHTGDVIGYEALTRLTGSTPFRTTGELFEAAERAGMLETLEHAARTRSFERSRDLPAGCLLFLNNSPDVLCHPDFRPSLERDLKACPWLHPRRVVLEVTEQSAPSSDSILDRHVLALRERGFAVAIDDLGSGMNGLKRMMALRPNWLKLDIDLINDIENDPYKQSVIRFVVHFAKLCNMRIIAEGVERHEQLARLIELGVSHAQGYFIAMPGALRGPVRDGLASMIRVLHEKAGMSRFRNPLAATIGSVAEPALRCAAHVAVIEALERLDSTARESLTAPETSSVTNTAGLVVVEGTRVVGWLPDVAIRDAALDPARRTQPVVHLCRADNLLVQPDLSVADALKIVSNRAEEELSHPLIVVDGTRVIGVVPLRRLLSVAAIAHGDAARHVSPLTGMPNRVQADLWLGERIQRNDPADIAFLDLRHFAAYNAAYGFEFGDAMLTTLAGLIRSTLVDAEDGAVFAAHLGEDRFMLAFHADPRPGLERLAAAFVEVRDQFFNALDRTAGAYASVDASGQHRVLPLTTVRALLIPKALRRVCTTTDLYEMERRLHAISDGATNNQAALPGAACGIIEAISSEPVPRGRSA